MSNEIEVVLNEQDALNTFTVQVELRDGVLHVLDCKGDTVAQLQPTDDVQTAVENHLQHLIAMGALMASSFTTAWYDW